MNVKEPIDKLSAGPVHFAYTGWAFVDILPESNPSPDENFFLKYHHPYSFEADSWINSGRSTNKPVCIMNSGYSSGWCEESYGIELTAVEITCKACGDDNCTFIMAPPHKIEEHLKKYSETKPLNKKETFSVPTFFERKKVEEEMKKAKIKAEQSDRTKSEFLANMSHEMRTPLNAIKGYINLLKKESNSEVQKQYLDIVSQSSTHLLNLIDDILDLSKIEAQQLMIIKNVCSLKLIIADCFLTVSKELEKLNRNIILNYNISSEISEFIFADPIRLKQVLYHLIINALKFIKI